MRTSHKELRKRIVNEKGNISDEELFASQAFSAYLADLAEGASKRYKKPIKVKTIWDQSPDAMIACTNNRAILINTGNYISMSFPTKALKADSLVGFNGHEIGHINFTDFKVLGTHNRALLEGRFYPAKPQDLSAKEEAALAELEEYFEEKNEDALKMIAHLAHDLVNITEDAYVNARMCQAFPGKFKTGIRFNQVRMMEFSHSITDSINAGADGYTIVRNLILQYSNAGEINNRDEYTGEYLDAFHDCAPLVDDCKYDDDAKARSAAANHIILKLWRYIKPLIEKAKKEGFPDVQDEIEKHFGKGNAQAPTGRTSPPKSKGYSPPDEDEEQEELDAAKSAVDYETERIELVKTEEIEDGSGGGVYRNNHYGGAGYENCGSDIERLLDSIAEDRVNKREEQELSDDLQSEAGRILYGNNHTGITVTVNRMADVPEELIREYKRVSQPLLLLSKRMQKQVKQILKEKRQGGKLSGLMMGRRFVPRSLVQDDGRHFASAKLPIDSCDLAVALLVDESGSMGGLDRITTARAASIVLYDFCRALGIPVMVMGHTAAHKRVELFSYADFDSVDGKDCYRIMDMTDRWSNRDGAALRYTSERLSKRPEQLKILIIISDGQPADEGYYGTAAEADLRGIRREYKRKGVTLFAAAIGDDKANIERIYEEGFLDITDLNKLPMNLTRLISRYIA
jgi:hypothetical protein